MHIPGYDVLGTVSGLRRFRLYKGRAADGTPVLLKVPPALPARPHDIETLDRETALLRAVSGPGVARVRELLRMVPVPCLVLEDGALTPVAARLPDGRPPLAWTLSVASRLCTILDHLHEREVIVAGLSPAGVLADNSGSRVEIADLASAIRSSPEGTLATTAETSPYIAPEQTGRINRVTDHRSDLYALGVMVYELLVGRPPFRSDDPLELIHAHIVRTPPAPSSVDPSIPDQVSRVVLKLLAKDAEDRYQSAVGVGHDLDRCLRAVETNTPIEPFPLAAHDATGRFTVPQRLYGRDREVAALTRAFDETSQGPSALLLVSGYSGVGKTSLISELYKPIVRQRGYFTTGKFDQVVRNIPYGALAHAFRALIWQLFTESEARLDEWRAQMSAALGVNGGVIAEVIPEIELIVGRQPPPAPLDPTDAQNRFRYAFQSFVGCIATREHPLVLFLDDLQWVDPATLELLHAILTSADIAHLLVIGAYRENEVDAAHRLRFAVERLEADGARVRRLTVEPLGPPDLLAFVADTLRRPSGEVEPLAALIQQKTDGNPFFVIQFLKTLVHDGLIRFSRERSAWDFRIEDIERAGITDNVVDLMTRKVQQLSPRGQRAVTLAACIGNQFGWDTLLTVSRLPPDEAAAGLAEGLDAGLLHRSSVGYDKGSNSAARVTYAFVHDRVQQVAYGLIPPDQRARVHLEVGRLLLAGCGDSVPDDRLFEVVTHLNTGSRLIVAEAERLLVARLNLAAGRKAKMSMAYGAAAGHLEHGLELIAADHWTTQYDLVFALHLETAECQYLAGQFDAAEETFRVLLASAASALDRAQVHALRITLYENLSRWADALASGREALTLFDISFPEDVAAQDAALDREIDEIQRRRGGNEIAALADRPASDDAAHRMLLRILTILWAPAYISGNHTLARLISATMVRLSLEKGNTEDSAYGYVTHAITVGPVRHDYRAAFEWGQLALTVEGRYRDPRRRAKIYQQFQAHVNLWRQPFATCIPYAREACRSGLETGDFTYAGYGAASEAWVALATCNDLERFVQEYTPTLHLLGTLRMADFRAAHRVLLNWARALQGRTAGRFTLSDTDLDEEAYLRKYEAHSPFFSLFVYAARLHLAMIFGDPVLARESWARADATAPGGTIWPPLIAAWGSLALAESTEPGSDDWDRITGAAHSLRVLAENCPENFRSLSLLVDAVIARRLGSEDALRLAMEAVEYARLTESLQHEAIASELHARLSLAAGDSRQASEWLRAAHRAYAAWGAEAKLRDFEQREPSLLHDPAPQETSAPHGDRASAAEGTPLDMVTVLKLARAIAVEIRLDDLLRTLMTIAMENAGAKRSVFIAAHDNVLTVEAEAVADPEQVHLRHAEPLEGSTRVPSSVVQYVRRTGQDVVLANAAGDERFGGDPYVRRGVIRSMLCVPVSHQGRLGGILYLEHELGGAFTAERIEMMRILAAQAAISLENSRLYEAMQDEVSRRTAAESKLRDALAEVEALKNRLEAENVYLQEEIQTQHNFSEIVGNTPALRHVLLQVERVAATATTVLITGETGTGKEIIARALHSRSTRRERPLVKVNCGAIPAGLVESELFGHVKGAFTGALQRRIGRFELADGGSIFLDEVGELPLDVQVKLLRVLQEQEFEPVGAARPVHVNVRVIAATNRDLEAMVKAGTFRADLFYRLNVFPIHVPPLRERREDIPLLVAFFLMSVSKKLGKPLEAFTASSLERMRSYDWPGNVRELQNVVERAAILAQGPVVDLHPELLPHVPAPAAAVVTPDALLTLEDMERQHILRVVRQTNWTIEGRKGAAVILGLHPNTLRSRMKKLGIARSPEIS